MISFGDWDPEIHLNDVEQVQRIILGMGKKVKSGILSLDKSAGVAKIQGSGKEPYECTLNECTCADFFMRRRPCKHIYAIADEMGLLKDFPKYTKSKNSFDSAAEIEKYKQLFLDGQMKADDYVKICKILSKM